MKSFRTSILLLVLTSGVVGCASDQVTQKKLEDSKMALEQKQFDSSITSADAVIAKQGSGSDTAAAYYLKGRSLEQREKANPSMSASDLEMAKVNYNRALQFAPPKKLEGYIRTSLANVDYFQDDFSAAFEEWSKAYDLLSEPDLKAWTLYRIGLSQQRMGRFEQADKTFLQVQNQFPNTEQAARSRERHGARGFQVQLATFKNPKSADAAVAELKQQGVNPTRTGDATGLTVIRVGPVATYAEAKRLKERFADKYADAIILP